MDEHVQRVCEPVLWGWEDYLGGRATLADLSRLAMQARDGLDSSTAPLPDLLWAAALELLALYDEGERESHRAVAQRMLEPILVQLDHRQ